MLSVAELLNGILLSDIQIDLETPSLTMLTLYSNFNAVCGQKVLALLHEKKLKFEYVGVNLRQGEQHSPEFIKLNPKAQVPVLIHNERVIVESSLICLYIEKYFPQKRFSPENPNEYELMLDWMKTIDDVIHAACSVLTWSVAIRPKMLEKTPKQLEVHFKAVPDEQRRQRQLRAMELGLKLPELRQSIEAHQQLLNKMEHQLSHSDFLAGDKISLADICVLPYIVRLEMLAWRFFWQTLPGVTRWFSKMQERESYLKSFDNLYPEGFIQQWQSHGKQAAELLKLQ